MTAVPGLCVLSAGCSAASQKQQCTKGQQPTQKNFDAASLPAMITKGNQRCETSKLQPQE
ncbi:MAG TPA: hypothetical protein DF774_09355 [Rheinheimera sp.]|nr:hypothetical protein [Rheinheimera sp.]